MLAVLAYLRWVPTIIAATSLLTDCVYPGRKGDSELSKTAIGKLGTEKRRTKSDDGPATEQKTGEGLHRTLYGE